MVNRLETSTKPDACRSDELCFLATSHGATADAAASMIPIAATYFAVEQDGQIMSSNRATNSVTTSTPHSRKDNHHQSYKYHQVSDDHIPMSPIFFPNPERHVPHHVHVPTAIITAEDPVDVERVLDNDEEIAEVSTFNDLVAGGIAGTVSVFVGHPFDTVKVRCQSGTGVAALKPNLNSLLLLYRGMGPPLCSAGAVNALVFSAYGWSSRVWDATMEANNDMMSSNVQEATVTSTGDFKLKNFVCGAFSGLLQTFILCPTEHIKCRLQVQEASLLNTSVATPLLPYNGPTDAAYQIYESHGIFRGLYRGWAVTAFREVPAFALYFSSYDFIKDHTNRALKHRYGTDQNPWIASGLAGGASGCFTWALVYPFDVIKTRIQTRSLNCTKGIYRTGLDIIAESGWRAMFRGLGVTLIRAFPVNGVIFPVYEFSLLKLTGADRMID